MEKLSFLGPAALFMVSMTLTPGPNNIMLTASGAIYGFRRTLPHLFGILAGCFLLFSGIALGLGTLFEQVPVLQAVLRVVGSAYLLYLAWLIATAPPPALENTEIRRPLSALQAAAFQFANPKAWIMGVALITGFLPSEGSLIFNALLLATVSELVAFPCIALWAGFGTIIGRLIKTNHGWRIFNRCMGALVAGSVVLILV